MLLFAATQAGLRQLHKIVTISDNEAPDKFTYYATEEDAAAARRSAIRASDPHSEHTTLLVFTLGPARDDAR